MIKIYLFGYFCCYYLVICSANLRIIGGENAAPCEFPHQISLQFQGRHHCGGSIINSRTILTAAHCLYQLEKNETITILVGTNFLNKNGTAYIASSYTVHENFDYERLVNDIAIVKLDKVIIFGPSVQPIMLPDESIKNETVLTLSGWGLTSFPGNISEALQKIDLKSIDLETCYYKNPINTYPITLGQLCTLSPVNYGACKGDSGGPLIDAVRNTQVGIVSWGVPCGKGDPDIFTSVHYYKNWIRNHIVNN